MEGKGVIFDFFGMKCIKKDWILFNTECYIWNTNIIYFSNIVMILQNTNTSKAQRKQEFGCFFPFSLFFCFELCNVVGISVFCLLYIFLFFFAFSELTCVCYDVVSFFFFFAWPLVFSDISREFLFICICFLFAFLLFVILWPAVKCIL